MKYEYKFLTFHTDDPEALEFDLTAYGADGWALFEFHRDVDVNTAILERIVEDPIVEQLSAAETVENLYNHAIAAMQEYRRTKKPEEDVNKYQMITIRADGTTSSEYFSSMAGFFDQIASTVRSQFKNDIDAPSVTFQIVNENR